MSIFGSLLGFGGGGKGSDVQTPQVASAAPEPALDNTLPQSEAEKAAIKASEDAERRRQLNKQGQEDTILTGGQLAESPSVRKTLLGA